MPAPAPDRPPAFSDDSPPAPAADPLPHPATSSVRLRTYTDDDADAVLDLNQSNLDGVGPLDPDRQRWLVSMADQVLVADDGGTLAGFAFVFGPRSDYDSSNYRWFVERMDDFGYLDRIVVAPTHRRRGIAGRLYDAAEEMARHRGRLVCEVYVEPPNTPSLAFHAARGYREVGRLRQVNGKTCTMLAKELGKELGKEPATDPAEDPTRDLARDVAGAASESGGMEPGSTPDAEPFQQRPLQSGPA